MLSRCRYRVLDCGIGPGRPGNPCDRHVGADAELVEKVQRLHVAGLQVPRLSVKALPKCPQRLGIGLGFAEHKGAERRGVVVELSQEWDSVGDRVKDVCTDDRLGRRNVGVLPLGRQDLDVGCPALVYRRFQQWDYGRARLHGDHPAKVRGQSNRVASCPGADLDQGRMRSDMRQNDLEQRVILLAVLRSTLVPLPTRRDQ